MQDRQKKRNIKTHIRPSPFPLRRPVLQFNAAVLPRYHSEKIKILNILYPERESNSQPVVFVTTTRLYPYATTALLFI